MNWKPLAAIASAFVAASAVVAVLAGPGGPGSSAVDPEVTGTATEIPLTTPTDEPATATPEPAATEVPATATPDGDDGHGPRDIVGIPDDNPNFTPDTDGDCEKGESATKTTPGGVEVNVPCHAAEQSSHAQDGHPGHDHGPPDGD